MRKLYDGFRICRVEITTSVLGLTAGQTSSIEAASAQAVNLIVGSDQTSEGYYGASTDNPTAIGYS